MEEENSAWLQIGKSFVEQIDKKPHIYREEEKETKKYFQLETRKTALDFIDMNDSSDSSARSEMKKKKKKHKKDKKRREKEKNKNLTVIKQNKAQNEEEAAINLLSTFQYKKSIGSKFLTITVMRFGNEEQFTYGLKVAEVPKFRRLKANFILGLRSDKNTAKILEELNYIQGFIHKKEEESDRYFFAPFPKINEKIERKNISSYDNNYLPFESKQLAKKNENKNVLDFSFDDTDMGANERNFFLKTKEFNEKITANPNDPLIWLDFLNYQEKSNFFAKKTNERQLEILNKALANPILKKNLPLIFYHLALLKDSENFQNKLKEYLSIQNENSTNIALFFSLMVENFATTFTDFYCSAFREKISECLKLSKNSLKAFLIIIKNSAFIEKKMGYIEMAHAIFEAVLEFHVFHPENLKIHLEKYTKFQDFWEKKALNKAESFSIWDCKNSNGSTYNKEDEKMKEEVDISLEKWLEKEIRISTEDSFTEEKTQNRLDSIIIFEDIQKFIFEFNCEQTKDFDILLINEYLDFLEMPSISASFFPEKEKNYFSSKLKYEIVQFLSKKEDFNSDNQQKNIDFYLKFPSFCSLNDRLTRKYHYLLKILYLLKKKNPSLEVTFYIFYLEGQLLDKENFSKSSKTLKNLLKKENCIFLWFLYIEITFSKTQDLEEIERIFSKVLEFTQKKEKLITFYFHSSFYLRNWNKIGYLRAREKILQITFQLLSSICKSENITQDSPLFLSKAFMIFDKLYEDLILNYSQKWQINKNSSKKSHYKFPLSKSSLYLYFKLLVFRLTEPNKANFLNESSLFLEKISFLHNFSKETRFEQGPLDQTIIEEEIQLLIVNYFRILDFHSDNMICSLNSHIDLDDFINAPMKNDNYEKILKWIAIKYSQNTIFLWKIIFYFRKNSFSLSFYNKMEKFVNPKEWSLAFWMMIIFCEILFFKGREEFSRKIDRLFLNCIEIQVYKRFVEKFKDNKNIQLENHLNNLSHIAEIYQIFNMIFLNDDLIKHKLLIHKIPFAKTLYLNYLQTKIKKNEGVKEVLALMYSKEMRIYEEIPIN